MRTTVFASIVVAVVLATGILMTSMLIPGGNTTTTTSTTTNTTTPGQGYGALAVQYLESRRDDVLFYWMCNSTFVNVNLTEYYRQASPDAFVDGVFLKRGATNTINVLFAPFDLNITGQGTISEAEWASLSGSLINDSVGPMEDALSHPEYFPSTWPIDFFVDIYFDDDTFFYLGYTKSDGLAFIQNGTWSGGYSPNGWPEITGFIGSGYWLIEGGHLHDALADMYTTITQTVSFPSP